MICFVLWPVLVWLAGWLALPFSARLWGGPKGGLPDAGLAAGRVLFLVVWAVGTFWIGHLGVPVRICALAIYPLGALCLFILRREWPTLRPLLKERWQGILVSELLLAGVFLIFLLWRGYWPDIADATNGEKPMDNILIAVCAGADFLPAPNAYAAPLRMTSYYYLGHLGAALLSDAAFSTSRWTYNLMCATLPALCFSSLAALCGGVIGRRRGGGVAACLLLTLGTLEPLRQWFKPAAGMTRKTWPLEHVLPAPLFERAFGPNTPAAPLDFFATSRVIPNTINEYPWFTFNFGDLHAHLFSMPLAVLALSLGWSLWGAVQDEEDAQRWKNIAICCGLLAGAVLMTNIWDFPFYTLAMMLCLLPLAAWAKARHRETVVFEPKTKKAAPRVEAPAAAPLPRFATRRARLNFAVRGAGLIFVLALLTASPLLMSLRSAATGPRLLLEPGSPLRSWLLVWAPIIGAWMLTLALHEQRMQARQPSRVFVALLAVGAPIACWIVLKMRTGQDFSVLLLLIALALWTGREAFGSAEAFGPALAADEQDEDEAIHVWLCRVALCGLLALLWSETTYAGFMSEGPFRRMDTVFKFGLQAWFMLGTAAFCGVARGLQSVPLWPRRRHLTQIWPLAARLALGLLLPVGLASSAATTLARARDFRSFAGLDAWASLPAAEKAAAAWLQQHAGAGENLIEAERRDGGDFSEFTRFAHLTGVPAVVGPQAHTFYWVASWPEVFERKSAVRTFYMGVDPQLPPDALRDDELREAYQNGGHPALRAAILQKYKVRFIIAGELERREYGENNVSQAVQGFRLVFEAGGLEDPRRVSIYELQPPASPVD